MNMLYDSEDFIVVHHPINLYRHAFEIVDKKNNKEILLDGDWATIFHQQVNTWHAMEPAPLAKEVEAILAEYAALAHVPMYVH